MQDILQENSLWQFALSFYQRLDNQQTLLKLQNEHGFSVTALLFLLYVDAQQLSLDKANWQHILEQTAPLQNSILSFRQQRFCIKQQQPELYSAAKQQEIQLEQLQLAIFYQYSQQLQPATKHAPKAWQHVYDSCGFTEKSAKLLQKLHQQIG